MQQYQKTIYEKCYIGVTGTAWVAGLLMAGSDSLYMPWFNGIGVILFFGASYLLGKLVQTSRSETARGAVSEFRQTTGINTRMSQKRIQRLDTRYAMEVRENRHCPNSYARATSTVTLSWCCPPPRTVPFTGVTSL